MGLCPSVPCTWCTQKPLIDWYNIATRPSYLAVATVSSGLTCVEQASRAVYMYRMELATGFLWYTSKGPFQTYIQLPKCSGWKSLWSMHDHLHCQGTNIFRKKKKKESVSDDTDAYPSIVCTSEPWQVLELVLYVLLGYIKGAPQGDKCMPPCYTPHPHPRRKSLNTSLHQEGMAPLCTVTYPVLLYPLQWWAVLYKPAAIGKLLDW